MNNAAYSSRVPVNDEIDLVELIKGLWAQKWLIALVTLVITLGAAAYAFLSKPVYEARVAVLPPSVSDVAAFNLVRNSKSGLAPYTVEDVYAVFTQELQSEENRRRFFNEVYLLSLDEERRMGSQEALYREFSNIFNVNEPSRSHSNFTVSVQNDDPIKAADWVGQYIDQVTQQALAQVLQNTRREVEIMGEQIQQEIKILRETAKTRREDHLMKLKEALAVAETVGLVSPPVIGGQIAEQLSAFMDGDLMYMRGTKALRAEIEGLEFRKSDDPFIPPLRGLEEQYRYLVSGIEVAPKNVRMFRQDGAVVTPDLPIKPKKALILMLGVLLGGMLGLFIALARLILSNRYTVAQVAPVAANWPVQTV